MIYNFKYQETDGISKVSIRANSLKEALLKYFSANDSFWGYHPDEKFKSLFVEVE